METVIPVGDNGRVAVDFPPPGKEDGFFAFGLHRSGSTLLNKLLREACREVASLSSPSQRPFSARGTPPAT